MSSATAPDQANAGQGEFARGWRVIAGSLIGIGAGVSSIYFYSLGIFIKPLAAEFAWSRGEASLGALVGTACAAVVSPFVGRLADRFGSLKVAALSLALLALGFFVHGWLIAGLTSFLVITALVSLLTAGSSPMPYTRLTVTSFARHRGLALGIVLGGTGLGAMLVPRLLGPFVAAEGWRAGYLGLGVIALVAILPMAQLLRSAPDAAQPKAAKLPLADIIRNPAFARLGGMFFLAAIAILGTVVQFVPMLSDAGMTPAEAGGIASLIGVAAIGGRLVVGMLLDRLAPQFVTAGLFAAAAMGLAIMGWGGTQLAVPGAIITGVAVGAEVDILAFLTARYFPRNAFGEANGLLYGLFLLGGAIGPALSGFLMDASGNYAVSLITAAVLLAAAAAVSLTLPPAPGTDD
jgi:MFS family permease